MAFFGVIEEFVSEVIYPYRWLILAGVIVAGGLFAALAYRKGWHTLVWKHRQASALVGIPLLAVTAFGGWYTLSPVFERTHLVEASPLDLAMTGQPINVASAGDRQYSHPRVGAGSVDRSQRRVFLCAELDASRRFRRH